jgi:hypothetical protein
MSRTLLAILLLATSVVAQTQQPQPVTQAAAGNSRPGAAVLNPELAAILQRLQAEAQSASTDLDKLRIEKWKTDSTSKQRALGNVESLNRNFSAGLPANIAQVKAQPSSMAANFQLYRNMNALYDVLASVAEAAGAFGKKEEYEAIAPHAFAIDDLRRSYADLYQKMAASQDSVVASARQATAAPPKKVVIDDTQPATPVKKKVPAKKKSNQQAASGKQ